MSNVPTNSIITIDDNDDIMEQPIENTIFQRKDLIQHVKNVTAEQSNAHKFDHINSNSDLDVENNLTRTFTAILGSLHGLSLDDVNKVIESEKDVVIELRNAIAAVSRVFKNSSESIHNKEIDKVNSTNTSEIRRNLSFGSILTTPTSSNPLNNISPINEEIDSMNTLVRKYIPMDFQQATSRNNKETQSNLQQDNDLTNKTSIDKKDDSKQISENSRTETLPSETRSSFTNNVPNYYVPKTRDDPTRLSGIKLGDNWELPIMVLDSDDDENDIVEVDSEEEEIQEVREMMSLDDIDCVEIGKDEFELVVSAKKGENVTDSCEEDTDEEIFIPVVPGEGNVPNVLNIFNKKKRRRPRSRSKSVTRRKLTIASNAALKYLEDDDPSRWRKDLPVLPYITNDVLRIWATGFTTYRKEWERLEYLGDKVLMFCVLRFATGKYLQYYTPSDIKVVTTFLVSNKLLAAYSLTLGLDKLNHMQRLGITKKVADAFEAYIGAFYLSDGEEATTRYLEQLMSPLFELVITNIQTGRDPHKIMGVISSYFNMGFLIRISRLSK